MVGMGNIHGNSHRWCMSNKGMSQVICFHDDRGAHGLFAEKFLENSVLNSLLQFIPEKLNNGRIYSTVHQPKRIRGAHQAVISVQALKFSVDDLNVWQCLELFSKRVA